MEGPRLVSDPLGVGFCVLRDPWYGFCCLECKNIAYIADFLWIRYSETPVWWGLNLCLKKPDALQNNHNPSILCWENARKVSEYWHILLNWQMGNIWSLFPCFLRTGCSDWTKSFCIVSGFSRHKFRVPTWGSLQHLENQLFKGLTPPGGPLKTIFEKKWKYPSDS